MRVCRFMNSTMEGNGIHSEAEAARLVQQIRFSGQSQAWGKLLCDLPAQHDWNVFKDDCQAQLSKYCSLFIWAVILPSRSQARNIPD